MEEMFKPKEFAQKKIYNHLREYGESFIYDIARSLENKKVNIWAAIKKMRTKGIVETTLIKGQPNRLLVKIKV